MEIWLADLARTARICFETAGIAVIMLGSLWAIARAAFDRAGANPEDALQNFRSRLGRAILLGLEFLVAGDIINTVAFEPNLEGVLVLAGIVLIRTFLSFSIELEITGRWPWQKNGKDPTG